MQFPLMRDACVELIKRDKEINDMYVAAKAEKFRRIMQKKVAQDAGLQIKGVITDYDSYDLIGLILAVINPMMEKLRAAAGNGNTTLSLSDKQFYMRKEGKVKPCATCTHLALDIACAILRNHYAIKYEETHAHALSCITGDIGREFSWSLPNQHLQPPPSIDRPKTVDVRRTFFEALMYQETCSDVRLEIDDDGKERALVPLKWKVTLPEQDIAGVKIPGCKVLSLPAHKVFLIQGDWFKTMFETNMKEKQSVMPSIPLRGYRYEIVDALIHFLYKGAILKPFFYSSQANGTEELNASDVLELLRLSNYVQFVPLQQLCLEKLGQGISSKNFLMYAQHLVASDLDHITKILQWFIKMNPKFDQDHDYELSDYTDPYSLIELLTFARSFDLDGLAKKTIEHSTTILKYDDAFISTCEKVEESANKELLTSLKELVKCNPDFSGNLKAHKKHFRAYATACAEL